MSETVINTIRRLTEPAYFKYFLIPRSRIRQARCLRKIRKTGAAKIVFIVSSLPMWRFQPLYKRLQDDPRFEVTIAIYPFHWTEGRKNQAVRELQNYFSLKGIKILDLSQSAFPGENLRKAVNPDIIFYPQPYNHLFWNDLDNQYFGDKLICYIPYGMPMVRAPWVDKTLLHNTAWRIFFHSERRKQQAQSILYNHGRNIRVTGDPISDLFDLPAETRAWKEQPRQKKKVIWAPHHSVLNDDLLCQNSFLWLYELMLKLAEIYKDQIQFCLKPHPKLFSSLCEHPDWGMERAQAYYDAWKNGENTQLNNGPYIDLFKESDAMIHDCSSFTAEYLFTKNPVFFVTNNLTMLQDQLNIFGKEALMTHYIGWAEAEIINFLEDIVLAGDDPKKSVRESFYQKHLLPPGGVSASENIYHEILAGIGF